jgi:hypothetical protein
MGEKQHQQRWRAEFEKLGYNTVRDDIATGGAAMPHPPKNNKP